MRLFVIRHRVRGLVALICGLSLGCGGGEKVPPLFSVTGKVTFQGKPVAGATVIFVPEVPPATAKSKKDADQPVVKQAAGEADDDGNFELLYGEKHVGAPAGKYKVAITAVEPLGEGDDSEDRRPSRIPEKFGNPMTSGLTAVVKDEDNVVNFNLVDDGTSGAVSAPNSGARNNNE